MKEAFIFSGPTGSIHFGLVVEGELLEYGIQGEDGLLNNIYLGKVQQQLKSLDAYVIDMGEDVTHLNYKDCTEEIKGGETVVIQVVKEPFQNKKSKSTMRYSMPGIHMILFPFENQILVSKKIRDRGERERLLALGEKIRSNQKFGIQFRTSSKDVDEEDLQREYDILVEKLEDIPRQKNFLPVPRKLFQGDKGLMDFLSTHLEDVDVIHINNKDVYKNLTRLFSKNREGKFLWEPSYDPEYDPAVRRGIQEALGIKVESGEGSYLFIEELETLTFVDVNSGSYGRGKNKFKSALDVNLLILKKLVQQLGLRNIGGMVVVDFITMEDKEAEAELLEAFKKELSNLQRKVTVYGFTAMGLFELSLHRKGASLKEIFDIDTGNDV